MAGLDPPDLHTSPTFAGHKGDKKENSRNLIHASRLLEHCGVGTTAEAAMNGLIYLVGLVVVIMFILSFLGLR